MGCVVGVATLGAKFLRMQKDHQAPSSVAAQLGAQAAGMAAQAKVATAAHAPLPEL